MAKPNGYTAEQIILKLREAEGLLSQGQTVKQVCRALEVSEQTYSRWRREYNTIRPHGSLGSRPTTPEAFVLQPSQVQHVGLT